MGIGSLRNERCPCGSGKKFKKCYLERENQKPLPENEEYKLLRQAFEIGECFHPRAPQNCQGKPIEAHTVPKSALAKIADNGHVWWIDTSVAGFMKRNAIVRQKLTGVSDASTFNGFCGPHDNELFRPIEGFPVRPIPEHAALLSYRAICHETIMLRGRIGATRVSAELDRGRSLEDHIRLQNQVRKRIDALNALLTSVDQNRRLCAGLLDSVDPSLINIWAAELDVPPDVMVSGVCNTSYDFQGRRNHDPSHTGILTVSMVASEDKGLAVLAWIGAQPSSKQFVESLDSLSDEEIPHALVRMAFEIFENRYWSPRWWETLGQRAQSMIIERLQEGRMPGPTSLTDDGFRLVKWRVLNRVRSWT